MKSTYTSNFQTARIPKNLQKKQILKFLQNSDKLNKLFSLNKNQSLDKEDDTASMKKSKARNQEASNRAGKFLKYFASDNSVDTLTAYLDRIQSVNEMTASPTLEAACYVYAKLLDEMSITDFASSADLRETRLLTFCVCLNVAQKYLFDRDIHPDSMQKLLGIKKKQLYQREIFVLIKVFKGCLTIEEKEFKNFTDKLYQL